MIIKMNIRLLVTAAMATLLLISGAAPAQRDCCQGDWWLKWNPGQRETYFFGYAVGYSKGFMYGCQRGTEHWPVEASNNQPFNKCMEEERDFSKGQDYFVNAVTEFYTGHPEVRDIEPYEVIDLLGKGLTVEQVRKYPFMRHSATPPNH